MELHDVQAMAKWIAETKAKDAADTCKILGITRARLSQMLADKEIDGRKFGGRLWIPLKEINRHVIKPGEIRIGRPRSGTPQKNGRR